jgi:hypothetical protein
MLNKNKRDLEKKILYEIGVNSNDDKRSIANKLHCDVGQVMAVVKRNRIMLSAVSNPTYDPLHYVSDRKIVEVGESSTEEEEPAETVEMKSVTPEERLRYLVDSLLQNKGDIEVAAKYACLSTEDALRLLNTKCRRVYWDKVPANFAQYSDATRLRITSIIIRHPELKTYDDIISVMGDPNYKKTNLQSILRTVKQYGFIEPSDLDFSAKVESKRLYVNKLTDSEWKDVIEADLENMSDDDLSVILGYRPSAFDRARNNIYYKTMVKIYLDEQFAKLTNSESKYSTDSIYQNAMNARMNDPDYMDVTSDDINTRLIEIKTIKEYRDKAMEAKNNMAKEIMGETIDVDAEEVTPVEQVEEAVNKDEEVNLFTNPNVPAIPFAPIRIDEGIKIMEEWDIESTNGMDTAILEKLQSELNGYIARISNVRDRVTLKLEKVKAKQELLDKIAELDKMKEEIMKKLEEI